MSKTLTSIIFAATLITLSGCDKFQSSNTVVLDLDAIANATGQAETIKQQLEQANQELNSQLSTISGKLNEQLAEEKKKMGKKPSNADKQNLQKLTLQANQKMQQAKTIASQKAQQYRSALILQLRKNIQPIAEKIASNRGADIVLSSNNAMIWFNPSIDITDEIIAEIRATPVSKPADDQTQDETKPVVEQTAVTTTEATPAQDEK